MPQLQVQVLIARDIPKSAVVVLNGGVAVETMSQFQETFRKLRKLGFVRLVLDLTHVGFINSTGLGFLVEIADQVMAESGSVALVGVQPKVEMVLDMLGMNAFFQRFDKQEEALAALRAGLAGGS